MFIITLISLLRVRKHLIYKSIDVAKIGIIIDNCKTFIDKLKTFNICNEESSYDFPQLPLLVDQPELEPGTSRL